MLDNLYFVKMQKKEEGEGNDRIMISHCLKNVFGLKILRYFTRVATITVSIAGSDCAFLKPKAATK